MAEVPKRAGPTLVGTSSATIYTALGANTWSILRTIVLVNELSSTIVVSCGIGTTNADAAGKRIASSVTLIQGEAWEWSGYLPLIGSGSTPDLFYAISDTAASLTVTLGVVEGP